MNENPGETPNPLNPNPAPASAEPTPVAAPAESVAQPDQPVTAQPVATELAVAESEPKGSVVEPKNKSKKGLIVTIILLLVAVIGGAVAAILILKPFGGNGDAVPMAIQKLFEDGRPTKVSMDGVITMKSSNPSLPVSELKLDFNSNADTASGENSANIKVTATLQNDDEFSFSASEVHTSNGDLYLKLSGIADALDEISKQGPVGDYPYDCLEDEDGESVNCIDYDYFEYDYDDYDYDYDDYDDYDYDYDYDYYDGPTSSNLLGFATIFEVIDDDWIRISGSDFSNITDMIPVTTDNNAQCLIDAADNLGNYGDDFAKLYKENPFINYSTNDLKITQKKNQLYLLSFDADKLANFLNAMSTSGFVNDILACAGSVATTEKISADKVAEVLKNFPELYVEIDNDYRFTRVYLGMDTEDKSTTITVDLSFDYPTSITIEEPTEYVDINEVLTRVLNSLYGSDLFDQTDSLFTF